MAARESSRQEIAERLRDCIVYAKKHDLNGDCDMGSDKCVETRNTLYNDIASCIEEYGNFNLSAEQVFTRLADLIDPTCYVVGTTSEEGLYGPTIFHHELSCGHTDDTGWPEPPAYCYECGARVVADGQD